MRIYKRGNRWCIDYRNPVTGKRTGKRIREIVGTNRKLAEDTLAKIRAECRKYKDYGDKEYFENISKQIKQIKFDEMVKIYLDYAKDNKKSIVRDRVSLSHWNNYLVLPQRKVKFGDLYLPEITVKMVEGYKTCRLREIKPVTMNWKDKKYIKLQQ